MQANRIFYFILILLFLVQTAFCKSFEPEKARRGMVVSVDRYASETGVAVLQKGGNAIDAAVAVAFTLAVTYPSAGNIGGGGFMIIRNTDNILYALDYREKAPLQATANMYLNELGQVRRGASTFGYLAAGVPGTVHGLWKAHQKFGKLPWDSLVKPAIRLAREGFKLDAFKANQLKSLIDDFIAFPASRAIFTKDGQPYSENDRFVQTDLARTLTRIANQGPDGFYDGKTARLIEKAMREKGGLITRKDLEQYHSVWRDPIKINYRGYQIYSMPPPSSGGIVLAEILNCLEYFNLAELGHNSAEMMRLWIEAERMAYADRARWLGDSDFVNMPIQRLLSESYAQELRQSIPHFFAGNSDSVNQMKVLNYESDQTTHFSIVDQWGNAVSNTYTLNSSYGSRAVVPGTGILLNNEMDDFSVKPGHPNQFGLTGGAANAIEPEKRMLSSMSPTIVTKDNALFLVLGAPGGSRIITAVGQVISNVVDFKMNIREAIEAPRFHHQWKPDTVFIERDRFNFDTLDILKNRGYKFLEEDYFGYVQGILIYSEHNSLHGWSDPRSNGQVSGY